MRLLKGLLLKPTLSLLSWILRHRNGNSIIIGGPLGWSWYATLDTTHHGSLEGPANAHRHSDLANIGTDDHHAQLHPTEHQDGGAQEISIAGLSGEPAELTTHKGLPNVHHTKYTNAEAIAAAKTDAALLNPSGAIIMWHGLIVNIPAGWVICDGNNSTPNLLTRFVEGVATAATDPGATGGATSKSHTSHKHTMPTHTHGINTYSRLSGTTGSQRHINTTVTDAKDPGDTNSTTVSSHSDIRPLYYDVAFIMKT